MLNTTVTGKTKLLGLIGNPVEHTISPQLHNTLSTMLGIDAIYIPIKVEKDRTEDIISGFRASNFIGFNATIPFKEKILKYVDEMTEDIKLIGSANTVKISDGRLYAYNTDADGFVRAFEEESGIELKGKKILMLGAGGTSRALSVKLAKKEAAEIHIFNRSMEKAGMIADIINVNVAKICKFSGIDDIKELQDSINGCDILINTTSVGLHPDFDKSPISDEIFIDKRIIVYDVIYNPVRTKLLKQAEAFGCKSINGLGMLFYQGVLAYELWMDLKIPDQILKELYKEFSNYLSN
jgi:shikimate 5-dehydrogenase